MQNQNTKAMKNQKITKKEIAEKSETFKAAGFFSRSSDIQFRTSEINGLFFRKELADTQIIVAGYGDDGEMWEKVIGNAEKKAEFVQEIFNFLNKKHEKI